jgi:hypothetical protein
MKFATVSKGLVMGLALVLASTAFAGTKSTGNKATLDLINPATVNGTKLKAGEYKLQWDGAGPNVEVSIMKGKNVVAKTTAKLVDLSAPSANTAAVVSKGSDGGDELTGVRFEGKKYALQIGDAADGAGSGK